MYSYVSKSAVKPARKICSALLAGMKECLQEDGIEIRIEPVGSAKTNLVTRNGNEPFDLDFDILVYNGMELRELKDKALRAAREGADAYGFRKIQDSTSAITCIHYKEGTDAIDFRLDLGIVVMKSKGRGYRLIHDKAKDDYVLNEKPIRYEKLEQQRIAIKRNDMTGELRKAYLEKKNYYLAEADRNHPSFVVYAEAVNQTYQKIKDKGGTKNVKR